MTTGQGRGHDQQLVDEARSAPLLEARGLTAGYGDLAAVRNIDLQLREREIVAIFGPNGAGKTTTLRTLAGALPPLGGQVFWRGRPTRAPLFRRVRSGMGYVPEERSIITRLSVRDNLRLGRGGVSDAVDLFPQLGPLLSRPAGLLSGGEQQMLTLARCLASRPAVLLVDELSLGLAPVVVDRLLDSLHLAAIESAVAVLLVEQQARRALRVADRWYLFRNGSVVAEGDASSGVGAVEASYLASATS
jgi:branched-chain amino acid transport system ATP-binding protein